MEGIGKEMFEEWMKRLMERIDRLDSIISVLINKEAAGVKYMDGERLYDNQDLCEMLRTSKRSLQRIRTALPENQPQDLLQGIGRAGVYQPEHGRGDAGRQKGAESEGRNGKESSGQNGEREKRRQKEYRD